MTLLHIEGFETFGTSGAPSGLDRKYTTGSAGVLVAGRTGGIAFRVGSTATTITIGDTGDPQTIIIAFGLKMTVLGQESIVFLRSGDPTIANNIVIATRADGAIEIRRSTTVLGTTATGVLIADTWHFIELKAKIDNTTGSFELKVDEVSVLSQSSIDTQQSNEAFTNHFIIRGRNGTVTFYDDLYILDTLGSKNNDFLGKSIITAIYPDAAGDNADWTPDSGSNFARVNENPTDDDTSHVEASVAADKDLHNYDSGSFGVIRGIQVNTEVRDTIGSGSNLKTLVKSGGTTDTSPNNPIAGTSYEYDTRILEDDPNGGGDWTDSALNAVQAGYEVG